MTDRSSYIGELVESVITTPDGRKLIEELDKFCGYGKNVFNPNNERQNIFDQGKQCPAVWLHEKHNKYLGLKK